MLTNPSSTNATTTGTANMTSLFGLAGGIGAPYQPYLNTQPTDWTIAINYASTSTCGTSTGGSGNFINSPVDIAIDASDNVWFANSQSTTGNLSELLSAGVPNTCILLGNGAQAGTVIDSASNVWVGASNGMYRYTPGTQAALFFSAPAAPLAVAADGVGNVYFTGVNAGIGSLYQLPGAASAVLASQSPATQISNTVGPNPIRIMPDYKTNATLNNIWVTSGSSFVSQVNAGTGTGSLNGFLTTSHNTSGSSSYGLSISTIGSIFVAANDSNAVTSYVLNTGTYSLGTNWPFTGTTAGISTPTSIAVDGRANTWIANNANGTSTGSVSVLSNNPTAISPSTGFQKAKTYLASGRAIAIDQAGDVWLAGDGANYITEIVGAAVPIYQPYAVGIKIGRFQALP
jgi:hypothetical protein